MPSASRKRPKALVGKQHLPEPAGRIRIHNQSQSVTQNANTTRGTTVKKKATKKLKKNKSMAKVKPLHMPGVDPLNPQPLPPRIHPV
jgi:hypothetical protein